MQHVDILQASAHGTTLPFYPRRVSLTFPKSYSSSLESALALLFKQSLLCDIAPLRKQHAWFAGSFRHEFFIAATIVCCQIVRSTQSCSTSPVPYEKTPADIMLDALEETFG